jgi:hypothetical protein
MFIGAMVLITALFSPAAQARAHLKISTTLTAFEGFNNWTAGRSFENIKSFQNSNASRPVVDLVLQLQALKAGGLDFDFELVPSLTYELAKKELIQGRVDLTAETLWDDEIAENAARLLKSDPVIRNGEFVKGIYVLSTNDKLLKLTSIDEVHGAIATVVASWALDVKTVESMQVKAVVQTVTPEQAFKAILKNQADFILYEFSAQADLHVESGGVRLVPVPGYKVGIIGSRSWAISRSSPVAGAVFDALVAGTKILRESGTIERAYTESGFFNAKVAGWKKYSE